jgi:urease accessory protein
MLMISQRLAAMRTPDTRLVLPFELRSRSRFRARLENGEQVGVMISRGRVLRGGDLLLADDGRVVEVAAAPETVSTAHADDARLLARAAFHLGNRHVALQIGAAWLRYSHDHVLDDMVRGLGLHLTVDELPFEPEAGAYHSHGAGESAHDAMHAESHHRHGDGESHSH